MILFFFTVGVTKGKWGTLMSSLPCFKDAYDTNMPLRESLPARCRDHSKYTDVGLRDLADVRLQEGSRSTKAAQSGF